MTVEVPLDAREVNLINKQRTAILNFLLQSIQYNNFLIKVIKYPTNYLQVSSKSAFVFGCELSRQSYTGTVMILFSHNEKSYIYSQSYAFIHHMYI